jgi:hypothetical protein
MKRRGVAVSRVRFCRRLGVAVSRGCFCRQGSRGMVDGEEEIVVGEDGFFFFLMFKRKKGSYVRVQRRADAESSSRCFVWLGCRGACEEGRCFSSAHSLTFLGQDSGGGEGEAKAAFSREVQGREPKGGPTTGRFPNGYGCE